MLGETYAVTATAGGIASAAETTLDLTADLRRLVVTAAPPGTRWRAVAALVTVGGSTALGGWRLDRWRAGSVDLRQDVSSRGVLVPISVMLPEHWDGSLTVVATNRVGATAGLDLTLWVAPCRS